MFYTIIGKLRLDYIDQYYNRLLENKHFFINFIMAIILAIIGYWRVSIDKREVSFFLPLIYLITLRFANSISLAINEKKVIIATRYDHSKDITSTDKFLSFIVMFLPIAICGFIRNLLD